MNNQVSLYFFKIPPNSPEPVNSWLSPEDKKRLQKMTSPKRRTSFLYGRFLIYSVLRDRYNVRTPKIKILLTGKPSIRGISFNLSHSGNLLVLAVTKKCSLGVDVELSTKTKNFLAVSQEFFGKSEHQFILQGRSIKTQHLRFKSFWSLKEAYYKASGVELTRQNLQIHFDLKKNRLLRIPKENKFNFFINKKIAAALCIEGPCNARDLHIETVKVTNKNLLRYKKSKFRFTQIKII